MEKRTKRDRVLIYIKNILIIILLIFINVFFISCNKSNIIKSILIPEREAVYFGEWEFQTIHIEGTDCEHNSLALTKHPEDTLINAGKKAIVYIYFTLWAFEPSAKDALPQLNGIHEKYKESGIEFYGILYEPVIPLEQVIESEKNLKGLNINYCLIYDKEGDLKSFLNSGGFPLFLLVDSKNRIRYEIIGMPNNIIEELERAINELLLEL